MFALTSSRSITRVIAIGATSALLVGGAVGAAAASTPPPPPTVTSHPQPSVSVGVIAGFPSDPQPAGSFDWHQRAVDFDAFAYDWSDRGDYTTIRTDATGVNLPDGESTYKMPAYFGDTRIAGLAGDGNQEAVTQIASVVGASLVGVNKSDQDGRNYVDMLRTFFHPDQGVASNTPSASSAAPGSASIWYRTTANILYYMLGDQYPDAKDMTPMLRSIADKYTAMLETLGGANADLTMQDFDFTTMTKAPGRNEGGEAAAGAAAILVWAHAKFGDERYLRAAGWAMDALERSGSNLYYEILPILTPYIAARLNAETNSTYDISKYITWIMQDSSTRQGWGTVTGTWGGKDISGLSGSRNDNGGYAFAMNSFATPLLAATAKYDARYADTIGRWMLNIDHASRFFYADQMPASQQQYGDRYRDDPAHVIAYEGLMRTGPEGILARGDIPDRSSGWGVGPSATSLGMYGSSWVGFMGASLAPTNVPNVLRTDLNALDFFAANEYPTYLYFNPNDETAHVNVELDGVHDLYDAVSDTVIATAVSGTKVIDVAPGSSVILVEAPAHGELETRGNTTTINDVVVGYDRSPNRDIALGVTTEVRNADGRTALETLTDGSGSTSWTAPSNAPQTLTLDLTGAHDVSQVSLRWGAHYPSSFVVNGSTDGSTWVPLTSVTAGRGGAQTLDFTSAKVRYVQIAIPQAATPVSLADIAIHSGDKAASAPVKVSSVANQLNIAAHLTDGSDATRWESAASDPQWASVDLGSTQEIGSVRLRWEAAAARAFSLQVSDDGQTWRTVASTSNATGGTMTIPIPDGTSARYVKVEGTQRLTQYAYSLFSLSVYGPIGQRNEGLLFGPSTADSGTDIAVTGHGFDSGESVLLSWDDTSITQVTADEDGGFAGLVRAPAPGEHTLTAVGDRSGDHSTIAVVVTESSAVAPTLEVSRASVRAGEDIRVTGKNFASDTPLAIELHSAPMLLGSVTTDGDGGFVTTLTIPADTVAGDHRVVVEIAEGQSVSTALTVTAAPPASGGGSGGGTTSGDQSHTKSGTLAATGADVSLVLTMGFLALLCGVALRVAVKARRGRRELG